MRTSNGIKEIIAASNNIGSDKDIDNDLLSSTIDINISEDDNQKIQLSLIPSSNHGLNKEDLQLIDLYICLIQLKVQSQETSSDASGSEAALALALKSGSMGLCFFDTITSDCYLSII